MGQAGWFPIRKALEGRKKVVLMVFSLILPLGIWSLVSYVPFIWHPMVRIMGSGESLLLTDPGELVEKEIFLQENEKLSAEGLTLARGEPSNPVFLPAPHEVAKAFVSAFLTPPRREGDPWLHESLLHSIRIILLGFFVSSLIGVPLGILCGSYAFFRGLLEPFFEFFRYLPAPAFGALVVAVWGIADGPKVALIFIGTFFQQVLVIANTTSKSDRTLIEAAQTLGVRGFGLLTKVVLPGILPDIWKDQRILLGWAWTYLIVAEVVGTSSGITFFINQQAKYRIYDYVFAAIIMIGLIGIVSDLLLAWAGKRLFPWKTQTSKDL